MNEVSPLSSLVSWHIAGSSHSAALDGLKKLAHTRQMIFSTEYICVYNDACPPITKQCYNAENCFLEE